MLSRHMSALSLSLAFFAAAPASATVTIYGKFLAHIRLERDLNFDSDQKYWPDSCAGLPTCTYDYSPEPWLGYPGYLVEFTSADGLHFTRTQPWGFGGYLPVRHNWTVPWYSVGSYTADLTKIGKTKYQVTGVHYSGTVYGEHFTGTAI